MPGRGPAPRAAEEKRNRNKPAVEPQELPAANEGRTPELPKTYRTGETGPRGRPLTQRFLAAVREWYELVARSPQATRFLEHDWDRLKRMAVLRDLIERDPARIDLARELRLLEASMGLPPAEMQRLHWRVANPPGKPPELVPVASLEQRQAARRDRLKG